MSKTVLVLEDEQNIRQALDRLLTQEEYTVFTASNIEAASDIIRTKKIDLASVDLKIGYKGDYGGKATIEELNKRQPRARIVVATAYELDHEVQKELSDVEYLGFVSKNGKQNFFASYVETIKVVLEQPVPKKCFVIMPFSSTPECSSDHWEDIYENTIKRAVERAGFNYVCYKVDLKIGNIIENIYYNLNKADVVIADLTDRNPNVYYELGIRHALRDSTLLITQSIKDVPFDLRSYALIEYDWKTQKGRDQFAESIKKALGVIEDNEENIVSPVRACLGLALKPN